MSKAWLSMRSGIVGTFDGRANLFRGRIVYSSDETTDLIAHGLCSYTSGGSLEINVASSPNPSIERVAAGHKRASHDDRTSRTDERDEKRYKIGGRGDVLYMNG